MIEKKYEEIGTNYRFFLVWRHASFAGNVIILYGAISLCLSTYKHAPVLACVVPFLASPIGVLLWIIDVRTRDLYHVAMEAGKKLEGEEGGYYTELEKKTEEKGTNSVRMLFKGEWNHSGALTLFFLGSSLVLFIIAEVILIFGILKAVLAMLPV